MARRGQAAYYIVDLDKLVADEKLTTEQRVEALADVAGGGGTYGLKIVEYAVNGPAFAPVYGVYYGPDEEKWRAFLAGDFEEPTEEEQEATARAAAAQADTTAERQNAAEAAQVAEVTKENASEVNQPTTNKNKNRDR